MCHILSVCIGDGIGSNTMSTNWITTQLNALELTPHSVGVTRRHVFDSDDDDSDDDDDDNDDDNFSRKAIVSEHCPTVSSFNNEFSSLKSTKKSSNHRSRNIETNSSSNDLTALTKICEQSIDNPIDLSSSSTSPSTDLKLLSNGGKSTRSIHPPPPSDGRDRDRDNDSFEKNSNSGVTIESVSRSERTAMTAMSSSQVAKSKIEESNGAGAMVNSSHCFSAVALSDQPLNSDVDAFIGRFSSTQVTTFLTRQQSLSSFITCCCCN